MRSQSTLENARKAVRIGPHALAYDIKHSTSIFVEQTANTPNKVQSGKFLGISLNAKPISRLKNSSPLDTSDCRPSKKFLESFVARSSINVTSTLFKYVKGFDYIKNDLWLQHPKQRALTKHSTIAFVQALLERRVSKAIFLFMMTSTAFA